MNYLLNLVTDDALATIKGLHLVKGTMILKLQIPGYTLIRSDPPSNIKHGEVCIYYRSSLPLKVINIVRVVNIGSSQISLHM